MLVGGHAQAQVSLASIIETVTESVTEAFHDIWRVMDHTPGNGPIGFEPRWKLYNGRSINIDSMSAQTMQEFFSLRESILGSDSNTRLAEVFEVREVVEVAEADAVEMENGQPKLDGKGRKIFKKLSSPDGAYKEKASLVNGKYYFVGKKIPLEEVPANQARGVAMTPMLDIAGLKGHQLSPAWKADNAEAAELVAKEVTKAVLEGKPFDANFLNEVRGRVNKAFVDAQKTWLDVHGAPQAIQLQLENIVQRLNNGETITGVERDLVVKYNTIDKYSQLPEAQKFPESFNLKTLGKHANGPSLLRSILDVGTNAQKDLSKIQAGMKAVARILEASKVSFEGIADMAMTVKGLTAGVQVSKGMLPNFSNIRNVLKQAIRK